MLEDLSLMRGLEGMLVLHPADVVETRQIMEFLVDYEGPAYLRLGRAGVRPIYTMDGYTFELGKGDIIREGKDLCIIATGSTVSESLIAAEKLQEEGVSVQVVNMASISPFDTKLTAQIAKEFKKIITVEDHSIRGGLGSCVAEVMAEVGTGAKLTRLGMKGFGESGTPGDLYEKYKLNGEGIYEQVKEIL